MKSTLCCLVLSVLCGTVWAGETAKPLLEGPRLPPVFAYRADDLDTLRAGFGEVYELARVTINGRDAGTTWTPPFRVELTSLLKPGRNTLRIEVPNVLKNHFEDGDAYQRPSGLLGPVRLLPLRQVTLADSPEPASIVEPERSRQMD